MTQTGEGQKLSHMGGLPRVSVSNIVLVFQRIDEYLALGFYDSYR